jgi:hypothetical protein
MYIINRIMSESSSVFIKVDDNTIINKQCIRWIKKIDECLHICSKTTGCKYNRDMHKLCKINNETSYNELNKHFLS